MAHDLHQGMVVRSDCYVPSETVGQVVSGWGSSSLPCGLAYTPGTIFSVTSLEGKEKKRRRPRPSFVCTVSECKEKFTCAESLETHMKLHQVIKPFTCNVCGKVCQTESRLNVHLARHANDGEECKCDVCGRSFSSRSALKKHKLRIHRPLPHVCPYCNGRFEEDRYMAIHIKRAHEKDSLPETKEAGTATLQVNFETNNVFTQQDIGDGKNYCKDRYVTNADGNEVIKPSPAISSSFECQKEPKLSLCDTSNAQKKAELVSPPIMCEMCTSTFPSVAYLEQHMAVHVNEKSLTCLHCDTKFTNYQLLSNHLKFHNFESEPAVPAHSSAGSFSESLSGQSTITKDRQVIGKYVCALCNDQFLNLGSLKRHQAKNHNSVDMNI